MDATVITIIPEIAAEVLSPDENTRTLLRKLRQYFDAGVKEVWVIDPESETAQIWTSPQLPDDELNGPFITRPAPKAKSILRSATRIRAPISVASSQPCGNAGIGTFTSITRK